MKIKVPCKLCDLSASCSHGSFGLPLTQIPTMFLASPMQSPALLRDMMLAAYLFRGEMAMTQGVKSNFEMFFVEGSNIHSSFTAFFIAGRRYDKASFVPLNCTQR